MHLQMGSLVLFSVVTELCNHHRYLILEHFHPPQKIPIPASPLMPAPGNQKSTLYICGFPY